jgi:hypothetical protein
VSLVTRMVYVVLSAVSYNRDLRVAAGLVLYTERRGLVDIVNKSKCSAVVDTVYHACVVCCVVVSEFWLSHCRLA